MAQENEKIDFSFGENWYEFIQTKFSRERVRISRDHMKSFLGVEDLKGVEFADVGCGSGIHSLAALDLGASRILSFDLDPMSVRSTTEVREMAGAPEHWSVIHGSVLDPSFVGSLGQFDLVYSWGVLHHTGQMWDAIRNAATLVKPGGQFYIALYTTDNHSERWLRVKRRYNTASPLRKRLMEGAYAMRYTILPLLAHGRNPVKFIREYQGSRGMSYYTDVKDWLGGLPYEHAKPEEVLRFGREELGMEMTNMATGEACSEYLFVKK